MAGDVGVVFSPVVDLVEKRPAVQQDEIDKGKNELEGVALPPCLVRNVLVSQARQVPGRSVGCHVAPQVNDCKDPSVPELAHQPLAFAMPSPRCFDSEIFHGSPFYQRGVQAERGKVNHALTCNPASGSYPLALLRDDGSTSRGHQPTTSANKGQSPLIRSRAISA